MEVVVKLLAWLREDQQQKKVALVIVFMAFLLDQLLMTMIVPILPDFLHKIETAAANTAENGTDSLLASSTSQSLLNYSVRVDHSARPPEVILQSTVSRISSDPECPRKKTQLMSESVKVGLLLASKSIVQLIINPLIGPLTNRIGYHIPMLAGFSIIFISTLLFAVSSNYILLLLARSLQGLGGSCVSVAGLGMLANVYTDDEERGKYMGIALSGLALGVVVGAPFGSMMYQFVGMMAPFLVVAVLALLFAGTQLLIFQPSEIEPENQIATPLLTLLKDPYILIAAANICFTNMPMAILEATLPMWMTENMCATQWQIGVIFLPDTISYLIGISIFGYLATTFGRWLCALFGMTLMGISTISFPFGTHVWHLIGPNAGVGLAIGMVEVSMMPLMGHLVDVRHVSVYGNVYAIADMAVCIGFALGPSIGGYIAENFGFTALMTITGLVNILFAPFSLFLRSPPAHREKLVVVEVKME